MDQIEYNRIFLFNTNDLASIKKTIFDLQVQNKQIKLFATKGFGTK